MGMQKTAEVVGNTLKGAKACGVSLLRQLPQFVKRIKHMSGQRDNCRILLNFAQIEVHLTSNRASANV